MNTTFNTTRSRLGSATDPAVSLTDAEAHRHLPRSRGAALITLAHFAFFVVTLVVLATAIGWPEVLRLPPAEVFERIRAAAGATTLGYFSYLISSLLMVPLAFALRDSFHRAGLRGWWLDALSFTGAVAGVLKTLGIVRWLLAMPALAQQHAQAGSASPQRVAIEATYLGVNGYAGSVGELLGVALYSGLWFAGVSAVLLFGLRQRFVGGFGLLVAGLTLALALRPFFPEIGALESIGGPLWLLWLLSLAVALWRGQCRRKVCKTPSTTFDEVASDS